MISRCYIYFSLLFISVGSLASELDVTYRIQPGYRESNESAIFRSYLGGEKNSREEFIVNYKNNGFVVEWTGVQRLNEHRGPEYQGLLNEIYWDTSVYDWDVTIGKKKVSWGTGLFFRPLDVLQNTPRREILPVIEEGLSLVSVERYFDLSSVFFGCATEWRLNNSSSKSINERCVLRAQSLVGDWEYQSIIYSDELSGLKVGFGITGVVGQALELHASAMYLHGYQKYLNRLIGGDQILVSRDPMIFTDRNGGVQLLLGGTYTWENNISLSIEYWHDDTGYSKSEWDDLISLSNAQHFLDESQVVPTELVSGNIRWSSQVYLLRNIMQDYAALRAAYSLDEFNFSGYVIYSPLDESWVSTISASMEFGELHDISFGLRYFDGVDGSGYKNIGTKGQAFMSWSGSFSW